MLSMERTSFFPDLHNQFVAGFILVFIFRMVKIYSTATSARESTSATGCAQTRPVMPSRVCMINTAGMYMIPCRLRFTTSAYVAAPMA